MLKPLAEEKGLYLQVRVPDAVPELVRGDATHLRQILVNIIGNAIKFTDAGGIEVTVGARPIPDDRIEMVFEVVDTGIGIASEKGEEIFEMFSQGDLSPTRRHGGTRRPGAGTSSRSRIVVLLGTSRT